jgi:hypothetical protein
MNRTGVPNSTLSRAAKIARLASTSAASTGRPRASDPYNSPANSVAAVFVISNCIAITAGISRCTSDVATPAN